MFLQGSFKHNFLQLLAIAVLCQLSYMQISGNKLEIYPLFIAGKTHVCNYAGCYRDRWGRATRVRRMPEAYMDFGANNTVDVCITFCYQQGKLLLLTNETFSSKISR